MSSSNASLAGQQDRDWMNFGNSRGPIERPTTSS
jgi:predicted Ser/Thr protein kinase